MNDEHIPTHEEVSRAEAEQAKKRQREPGTGRWLKGGPGPAPGVRRRRGTQNKITTDLKKGIIQAAVALGRDGRGKGGLVGYLEYLAVKHPRAYASLLGRLIPLQLTGDTFNLVGSMKIVAVPHDRYLSAEEMRAQIPHLKVIEGKVVAPDEVEVRPEQLAEPAASDAQEPDNVEPLRPRGQR